MKEYLESKKILAMLWGFSLTMYSGTAWAACIPGDCTSLGYTKSEASCEGDIIRCPFDTSKVFCREKEVYVMQAGDILYSNKTTSHYYDSDTKTPIGVVVDPDRRLAMTLKCITKEWATSSASGNNVAAIPDKKGSDAQEDYNGKSYTKAIVDDCAANCPAAYYAYNYTTTGTAKGEWFLPSGGQLWLFAQNYEKIEKGLSKVGAQLPGQASTIRYLSSNEAPKFSDSYEQIIHLSFLGEPYLDSSSKGTNNGTTYVCPFIKF